MNKLFETSTRLHRIPLDSQAKGSTNPLKWALPKTGILAGIGFDINLTIAGSLSAPNALGVSSAIRQIRVYAGNNDIINITGPQYHHLLRDFINDNRDPVPHTAGRTAVTATSFDVSCYIPIAKNMRDQDGLLPLQHEQFNAYASIEFETDSVVATGATITGTVQPYIKTFDLPEDPAAMPDFSMLHTILQEQITVSGAGQVTYPLPTGDTFMQLLLGSGFGVSGSDLWSLVQVKAAQNITVDEFTPGTLDIDYGEIHGVSRRAGVVPLDWNGSNLFGSAGGGRDNIHMEELTDVKVVLTATGAHTLNIVKRQLSVLK